MITKLLNELEMMVKFETRVEDMLNTCDPKDTILFNKIAQNYELRKNAVQNIAERLIKAVDGNAKKVQDFMNDVHAYEQCIIQNEKKNRNFQAAIDQLKSDF